MRSVRWIRIMLGVAFYNSVIFYVGPFLGWVFVSMLPRSIIQWAVASMSPLTLAPNKHWLPLSAYGTIEFFRQYAFWSGPAVIFFSLGFVFFIFAFSGVIKRWSASSTKAVFEQSAKTGAKETDHV